MFAKSPKIIALIFFKFSILYGAQDFNFSKEISGEGYTKLCASLQKPLADLKASNPFAGAKLPSFFVNDVWNNIFSLLSTVYSSAKKDSLPESSAVEQFVLGNIANFGTNSFKLFTDTGSGKESIRIDIEQVKTNLLTTLGQEGFVDDKKPALLAALSSVEAFSATATTITPPDPNGVGTAQEFYAKVEQTLNDLSPQINSAKTTIQEIKLTEAAPFYCVKTTDKVFYQPIKKEETTLYKAIKSADKALSKVSAAQLALTNKLADLKRESD